MKKKNILFLSYDGLLDPLGRSQIVPYLECISKIKYNLTVLSFEKKKNFCKEKKFKKYLEKKKINWYHLSFTNNLGKFGKIYDLSKLFLLTFFLILFYKINILHCRSHICAFVGLFFKKIFNIKFIFDFRGFWIEERFDYQLWSKKYWIYRSLFRFLKFIEKITLKNSIYIVCLTYKAKYFLQKMLNQNSYIKVIPCCADYNFFQKFKNNSSLVKKKLNIKSNSIIIGYCGSINNIYLIKSMINFYLFVKKKYKNLYFLFITQQQNELIKKIKKLPKNKFLNDIIIISSDREKIPFYLSCVNISISFIKNKFSRKAMSPTKMFESFAMGIPFICNKGIGDVNSILSETKAGHTVNLTRKLNSSENLLIFKKCLDINSSTIIKNTKFKYDIKIAKIKYNSIYKKIFNNG